MDKKNAPWFDNECRVAVDARRASMKKFLRACSNENFLVYEAIEKETKKLLKHKKKMYEN